MIALLQVFLKQKTELTVFFRNGRSEYGVVVAVENGEDGAITMEIDPSHAKQKAYFTIKAIDFIKV